MFSFYTLKTIARFEMRTLLRSWFFRIFAGLTLFGLGSFNITVFLSDSGVPWIFRALPASVPYANLIILNLGQAIVAIFMASEFLKQDRKNDSVEVIYARSMTNAEYILGKALGILSVFFLLNVVVLLMGMGFSFMSNDSSHTIMEFFLYPLLISLPTLVFILGLSFFLMILLRNQAITFILLLGYIALTIFYLNDKYYHLLDYIAYKVPMMNSSIAGFGNLPEVLLHRGVYFFLGIGFILLTVFRLQRLPQSKVFTSFPLYLAIACIGTGGFMALRYIQSKESISEYKRVLVDINNRYVDAPRVRIEACDVNLQHMGNEIVVSSSLDVVNHSGHLIDTLLFSLNPSLSVNSVKIDDISRSFLREEHLLKVILSEAMPREKTYHITMNYSGSINEKVQFLDQDPKLYKDNFSMDLFRVRKRYSYLQDNFVCLTRDALWYPVAGVGYSSKNPMAYLPDFTRFSLNVKTSPSLMALSQGEVAQDSLGNFKFTTEGPLPKISLLIGDYKKYEVDVDSIEYSLFCIKGNDYFKEHFTALKDTLPSLIREIKNEYETSIGMEYPFKRFSMVEVPVHLSLEKHLWSVTSEAIQPQMVLYPEKGVVMEGTDFKHRKSRFERRQKRGNEQASEQDLQSRLFKGFIRSNFMGSAQDWYRNRKVMDRNTFSLFPNYYNFVNPVNISEIPALNLALSVYLKNRSSSSQIVSRWAFQRMSKEERINLALKDASLKQLMVEGVDISNERWENKTTLNDVVQLKGEFLFSLLRSRFGKERFDGVVNKLIAAGHKDAYTLEDLDALFQKEFGQRVSPMIEKWYTQPLLPGYLIKDLQTYRVKQGEHVKYQVRFKISNPKDVDGIVTVNVAQNDPNGRRRRRHGRRGQSAFNRMIYVPAHSAREVGFVFTSKPARMNIYTHISENLPNSLVYDFGSFDKLKRTEVLEDIVECEFFSDLLKKNEIIVDNEDPGFEIHQQIQKWTLKSWLDERKTGKKKYERLQFWSPPNQWKTSIYNDFYGKFVRSGAYTKSGDGARTVSWKAPLKEDGLYDVYCHIAKLNYNWTRQRKPNYTFKIYTEGGIEEVTRSDEELEKGWNYLGSYFITRDSAKVVMSNKSVGAYVFADAIKWVENK